MSEEIIHLLREGGRGGGGGGVTHQLIQWNFFNPLCMVGPYIDARE